MEIALLCGGPSLERGISLNSARSVLDHLSSLDIEIVPIYFDFHRKPYRVSPAQLYSNTPSDFDFKLHQTATPLAARAFVELLRGVDLAFPVMHGPFGEDGGVQRFLEKHRIPFVGSPAAACKKAFDKFDSAAYLRSRGFFTLPSVVLKIHRTDHRAIIEHFFRTHKITRAVVKPASGGSSIGVFSVANPREALEKARMLFSKRMDTRVVVEEFAEGVEFTTVILENRAGLPVALPPTEIETDYTKHQIFDFRRKYLPTRQVIWHCPPRFDNRVVEKIQAQAEELFALFGMRDFARFDGWVLKNGTIWFCDFNPVSGMEQNSFLFQQGSRVGMTHADVLRYIVERACARHGIDFPHAAKRTPARARKPVAVLFGGETSERQVSLMSGTNVWLKLRASAKYEPRPYLLGPRGTVWELPYHLALNHTVEEIAENCANYRRAKERLAFFEEQARIRLGLREEKDAQEFFEPQQMSFEAFLKNKPFIFNALHGGPGEDGAFQALFAKRGIRSNGPDARVSKLCMDKWETSERVRALGCEGVSAVPGRILERRKLCAMDVPTLRAYWRKLRKELGAATLVVKPRADGCSTGVVHLYSSGDLAKYAAALKSRTPAIPAHTFRNQRESIEMPPVPPGEVILERFVATDALRVVRNRLHRRYVSGWVEMTAGVVEEKGKVRALNPSITIAEGEVLSVEEKFQGGTGVNITPPPPEVVKPAALQRVKAGIEAVARRLGIRGYSRVDFFAHVRTGEVQIIEVNTLPALTPSTVFFHQALAEKPPLFPREFIEALIANKGY